MKNLQVQQLQAENADKKEKAIAIHCVAYFIFFSFRLCMILYLIR